MALELPGISDQCRTQLSFFSSPTSFSQRSSMSFISKAFYGIAFFSWDVGTAIVNLIIPPKSKGKVTPEGHPGFGGKWPEYVPPKEGDSRCSCPALNAMANHGKSLATLRAFSAYLSLCPQVFCLMMAKTSSLKKWANSFEQHTIFLRVSATSFQNSPRI